MAPSTLTETHLTSIPNANVATPAQTASNAVANEISVGSRPLSMNAAILCSATVPTAIAIMPNTTTRLQNESVRIASRTVQETSRSPRGPAGAPAPASRSTGGGGPSGSRPMSSG